MANKFKIILGIETSCDETAAAVLQKQGSRITILSNVISSSAQLQAKYGGIIPEQAAREQLKVIIPVIEESLQLSGYSGQEIDAIAVTYGPGLIGSLLVGVETAKTLALTWNKPLIPVNHLLGHFYANFIDGGSSPLRSNNNNYSSSERSESRSTLLPSFPILGLLVSGGHTDLVLFKDHMDYQYLGGTRDDAAGECFDKSARLLGLPYPGGPEISKLALKGNPLSFNLPKPMLDSGDYDFSFSGLKTAVANIVGSEQFTVNSQTADLAASLEEAITETLVRKTIKAAKEFKVKQIMLAGGVAANQKLKEKFIEHLKLDIGNLKFFVPPPNLCTDNGAMIASAAFFVKEESDILDLQANPNLSL